MKEETKKKLCKISKIVGFAITFGFAVFGALCAAMLIGNGSKKDDIKTLDSSLVQNEVRSERNIKPRKAPDINGAYDYFDQSYHFDSLWYEPVPNSGGNVRFMTSSGKSACFSENRLPNGYYYLESDNSQYWFSASVSSSYLQDINAVNNGEMNELIIPTAGSSVGNGNTSAYLYVNWDNIGHGNLLFFRNYSHLYLVDTLELPATSSVYLGDNWNPLKAFGDTLSEKGGYLLTDETWTANSSTYKNLSISGLVFKYEGVVYDRIYMIARPLNSSAYPYVDSSGAIVERAITQNTGPNEIYVLDYVGFGQSWLYDGLLPSRGLLKVMVGGKADTPSPSGKLPYNGSLQWVTSSRTIQIIDNKGTTTGRYDNRFSYMTDLEFINMLAEYESEAVDVVNGGQMFGLFTNAFDSLLPILSIAVLPNITLGMLLFIPLIGAIIVVVIRVVKK